MNVKPATVAHRTTSIRRQKSMAVTVQMPVIDAVCLFAANVKVLLVAGRCGSQPGSIGSFSSGFADRVHLRWLGSISWHGPNRGHPVRSR